MNISFRDLILGCAALSFAASGYWLRFGAAQEKADEPAGRDNFAVKLALAALDCTKQMVRYDPAYVAIPYPGGDVPADTGVCTDVVIRSYRALGIDLQKLVHEDMTAHFSSYPKLWGLKKSDPNIDHRRVPNLQTFFTRHGRPLPVSDVAADYLPGDVVAWDLNGQGLWHIGIVTGLDTFVHNIGGGQVRDIGLFQWKIVGHYRFQPKEVENQG